MEKAAQFSTLLNEQGQYPLFIFPTMLQVGTRTKSYILSK